MAKAQEVDVNDPETWPEDMDELAKLADDMPDDRAGIEKPTSEDTPKEPPKETSEEKPDTTAEGGDKPTEESEDDPDGVMAKDGKNVLPFGVLQKEREKSHAQAERIAELEKAVAASIKEGEEPNDDPKEEGGKTPAAAAENDDDLQKEIDSLEADIEKNLEEYGDESLVSGIRSQVRSLKREQQRDREQAKSDSSRSTTEIQDALDNSPKLSGWSVDKDQTNHNRATALHAHLMETDPAYAEKSWTERFKELPGRVEALYGAEPAADKPAINIEKAKQDAGKAVPKSISDIQGGDAPAGTDLEELETMSASSITQKMMDFKSEEEMEAFVRGLS